MAGAWGGHPLPPYPCGGRAACFPCPTPLHRPYCVLEEWLPRLLTAEHTIPACEHDELPFSDANAARATARHVPHSLSEVNTRIRVVWALS